MLANIKIEYNDKLDLLKLLESVGVPFEMTDNIVTVNRDNDMRIIAALTLCHYNYSVTYSQE